MEPKPFSQSSRDIELLEWDEIVLDQSNGRIKWRYTAASKTGQSCSNIQLLNEDEASLNQLGKTPAAMEERGRG
ncbi:unnamed protein product [Microthlaspi erraticum]|uniref:Uncharacterized protein n=1 Tax=Microthlaspi erraticum TaxID=1685480 RepID=A0A6D2JYX6_9BRAS|nr:unnamed protein product [Microthlaspi erraticum]